MRQALALFFLLCCAGAANAQGTCPASALVSGTNCYFIAASGVDTNNGTSESTPWAHAPGMPNCSNTCAGVTPTAGQGFIFRGGDTWHRQTVTPTSSDSLTGGLVNWTWSGTSSNCNYPSVTSSCIYYGVDTTWYNSSICGGSFCRPKFNLDNPTWANSTHQDGSHPGFVTSCTNDYNSSGTSTDGAHFFTSYVIIDNWEILGKCWSHPATSGFGPTDWNVAANVFIHGYVHGWTEVYNPQTSPNPPMDQGPILTTNTSDTPGPGVVAYSVFDGTDSCPNSTASSSAGCINGPVCYGICTQFYGNVVRWIAIGGVDYATTSLHDNLFEDIFESYDPASHSQVWEAPNPPNDCPTGSNVNVYNNVVRNVGVGVTFEFSSCTGFSLYFTNNVMYGIGNGSNGLVLDGTETPIITDYITNNTFVQVGPDSTNFQVRLGGATSSFNGNVTLQNNHMIGGFGSPLNSSSNLFNGTTSGTITDSGGEEFQTLANANTQGYSTSNNFAPPNSCTTQGTGAGQCITYHSGNNLSGSCSTYVNCNGTTEAVASSGGTIPTLVIASPNSRSTTFDAGAYQGPLGGTPSASAPTCTPSSGTPPQNPTCSSTTPSNIICWTLNGTSPQTNGLGTGCTVGTQYVGAISVSTTSTLKAIAGAAGYLDSAVNFYTYSGSSSTVTAPCIACFTQEVSPGDWQSRYGADGYDIALLPAKLPSYASLTLAGDSTWNWSGGNDPRGLSVPGTSVRESGCWYAKSPWTVDISITDGKVHPFTLYAVDWDSYTRCETFTWTNPAGAVLDSRQLCDFNAGAYLTWNLSGHSKLTVTNQGGANSVISGMFFQ